MAGSDNSAEIKALVSMLIISLLMGAGVLYFKKDYRLKQIWQTNIDYYPNAAPEKGDAFNKSKTKSQSKSVNPFYKSAQEKKVLTPAQMAAQRTAQKEKEQQELLRLIETKINKFYASDQDRLDLEGEDGVKEFMANYDGDVKRVPEKKSSLSNNTVKQGEAH